MVAHSLQLTRRVGAYDPLDPAAYRRLGGFAGLEIARGLSREEVVDRVKRAGLSGRGGAGFGTGQKWEFAAREPTMPRYLICNADEGELGTLKDKVLLEGDPWAVLEGMLIAAYAIGADDAYLYLRGEYREAHELWSQLLAIAESTGVLGGDASPRVHLAKGRELYIAGEELALIASLEMRRPMSRLKPPYPAQKGLFGKPTVVNNVETLAAVPLILTGEAVTTRLISLSGDVRSTGVFELEIGDTTLREIVEGFGGGTKGGRPIKAVQPGGGTTALLGPASLDTVFTPEAIRAAGSSIGTAGVIVYEEGRSGVEILGGIVDFYGHESCGHCFPCRIGMRRMHEILDKLRRGDGEADDLKKLREVACVCGPASNCGLGQAIATPVLSALDLFPGDFDAVVAAGARHS